jgi:hypothetical protein
MIPSDISGLQQWLKADQITGADADPIGTWQDQSGNGKDITGTLSARPTLKLNILNGKAVARFDGAANALDGTPVITGTTARTIILVVKSATVALSAIYCFDRNATPADGATFVVSPDISVRVSNGNRIFTVNTGTTAFHVLTMSHAAAANVTAVSAWMDGTALTQSSTGAMAINGGSTGVRMGDSPAIGVNWGGDVAEVIIYNTELSAGDRASIHSYLQDKYAIAVSDYVASGPTPVPLFTMTEIYKGP